MKWRKPDTRGALVRRALLAGTTAALALSFTAGGFSATAQADTIENCGGGGTYFVSSTHVVTGNLNCAGAITLPADVTAIADNAFAEAPELTGVTIPASVTSIGASSFYNVPKLTSLTVAGANATFKSVAGVLFNKAQTNLILYPRAKAEVSYEIPEGVTSISENAFRGANVLASVTIPVGVTTISNNTFYFAGQLASVTIPSGVTRIGEWAFTATALTSVTIPSSVTNIDARAFYLAGLLATVNFLGNAPTTVGASAFGSIASGARAVTSEGATGFGAAGSNFYGLIVADQNDTIVTPTAPVTAPATPLAPNTDWGRLNERSNTVVALIVPEVGVTYSISGTQTATKAAASGKKTIRGSCKKVRIKKGKKTVSRVSCRIKLSKGKWLVSITPKKKGVAGKTSQKTFRVK